MSTFTFKATEMKDAKVAHISLVDRAATRIPFKVIKQEKPMSVLKHLDLASVFKKEKAVATPEIIGVITMKSEGFESVKGQIKEAGFSVEKAAEMEDGSVVFGQTESMEGDHVLIRLSENAVMAVKCFSPYNMNMSMTDGTSFADVCKAQGFYPGVGTMVDVLRSGVLSLAEKADDQAAAAIQVGKMFDEAKQYAMTMVQALPSMAFKLESVFPEEPVANEDDPTAEQVEKASMTAEEKTHFATLAGKAKFAFMTMTTADRAKAMAAAAPAKKEEADPTAEQVEKAAMSAEEKTFFATLQGPAKFAFMKMTSAERAKAIAAAVPARKEDVASVLLSAVASASEEKPKAVTAEAVAEIVGKQISEFSAKMEVSIGGLVKSVEGMGTSVQSLSTRVEAAEGVAKAATKALEGTVVLGSDGGDPLAVALKTESRGREIDTGFLPVAKRSAPARR